MLPHRPRIRFQLACLGVVTLAIVGNTQELTKKALGHLVDNIKAIETWKADELKRLADEWQEQDARWKKLAPSIDAIVLEGQNRYREAAQQLERAIADYESSRDKNDNQTRLYLDNMVKLAYLYAEMSEYDQAEERARRAWNLSLARAGSAKATLAARIQGSLTLAGVLHKCGKPHEAAEFIDQSMQWCRELPEHLYRSTENSLLAACLLAKAEIANSTGQHHAAHDVAQKALDMLQATGSKRHPNVAAALYSLSVAAIQLDRAQDAFDHLSDAQNILAKYYVNGHPSLAAVSCTMAQVYFVRGKTEHALQAVEEALREYQHLFPESTYPRGHPGQILAMASLGDLLEQYGQQKAALDLHSRAWRKSREFYGRAHVNKLAALLGYARSLRANGQLSDAWDHFQQAESMARQLEDSNKQADEPYSALCLVERGVTEAKQGRHAEALATLGQALAMYKNEAAHAHPRISLVMRTIGAVYFQQGNLAKARSEFAQALALDQRALARFAGVAAEAEAMAYRGRGDQSYHAYLTAGSGAGYDPIWTAKATVTRLLQQRRAATRLAGKEFADVRRLREELIDVRTQLGRLIRTARETGPQRARQLAQLQEEKERLEHALAKQAPALAHLSETQAGTPADLARRLPAGSVFVDFIQYEDALTAKTPQSRYCAFVIAPGAAPVHVDLGLAAPIGEAVKKWREAMKHWQPGLLPAQRNAWQRVGDEQAAHLCRLVWQPVAAFFPPGTQLIYVAPDADLVRFPFAALPGAGAGTILLEECMIAYVPHGPFLLEQLQHPAAFGDEPGRFLAVGGMEHGMAPTDDLPGAAREIEEAVRAAGFAETVRLQGDRATVPALCAELPRAGAAHFATHGFFSEKELAAEHAQLRQYLKDWRFESAAATSIGLGRRSPLGYTGLVLARPHEPGKTEDDVLSGETIAELPLDKLRLVVLSACETGLGETTAGEGVQGLQRAFHLAGCPNVVATLWRVDDAATRMLMAEFYRQLHEHKRSPLEALCRAQRKLYRASQATPAADSFVHARFWAGFVYSGGAASLSLSPDDPRFCGVDEMPPPHAAVPWLAIGGVLAFGVAAGFAAYWRRTTRLPMATIVDPADAS